MRPLPRVPVAGEKITTAIFRDIVNYLRAITPRAGRGVMVTQGPNGTVIESTATGTRRNYASAEDTQPFALRYHTTDGDESGQVEVYLPTGSMTTEEECVPLNVPACVRGGHDGEEDWYAVDGMDDLQSGDTGKIVAYVMPGHHMIVSWEGKVDDRYPKAAIVRYTLADFEATDDSDGNIVVTFGTQANTGSKHTTATAVYAHGTNNLSWELEKDASTKAWKIKKLSIVDVTFDAGGQILTADDEEIGEEVENVYLKVNHADREYSVEVAKDPEDTTNDDDKTWRRMYGMYKLYPVTDYRFTLNTMMFLR